jgi:transposase
MKGEGKTSARQSELRGAPLDVVRELLGEGRTDDVLAVVAALVSRNRELEMLLANVREGRNRGEHVSSDQLALFAKLLREQSGGELAKADQKLKDVAEQNGGRPDRTTPAKQPPVRRPLPPQLRRVPNPIAVPASERPCPECGAERTCIAHETTEVAELIPAEVIVRQDIREILACRKCDAEVVRAPMGDKVIAGGAYGSYLVADLVVGKYWDSLPLNRQGQKLERLGLSVPSSSMADQITWAAGLLRPVYDLLRVQVLIAQVMHVDATSIPVRDSDSPKGIHVGSLWGYVGDTDVAVYLYTSTGKKLGQREGELGPEQFLALRRGPVVADAANLFDASFRSDERMEIGCNMHARRYFVKALDAGDARAAIPIAAFRTLYDVEDASRDSDPDERLEQRQRRSKPVYDELLAWVDAHFAHEPPNSLLGAALRYLDNHRIALTRFLEDGVLPIDNGIVERLHRRPAVGRRNYLFAGSHAGAERAAIAYSICATCALLGINPVEYLADVLPRLARGILDTELLPLTPAGWKAARAPAPAPVAAE